MTQNNLGNALQALGELEAGTERLEAAVAAYRRALEERTQDRVPLDWATVQNNLGSALLTLGKREAGTERLEAAFTAYHSALKVRTQDRTPFDWAVTVYNLSVLHLAFMDKFRAIGDEASVDHHRREGMICVQNALSVYNPDTTPRDYDAATTVQARLIAF